MIKIKGVLVNIRFYYAFASILGIGIVLPNTAVGQVDTAKINQLNEVKITEYKNGVINLSPVPVQVLYGNDLKRLNSLSVADAIRYFSGVQLKDYGGVGGLKTINVRSMSSNHTAVFYDGIQLGNAQNGQVDLGKFSLDNLEEIAIYVGQKPELLMPAKGFAAASALYLKTAQPIFISGKKYGFGASFKTGSFGLINPNLSYKQKISNKISFLIDVSYLESNGKYRFRYKELAYDTTIIRNNSDVKSARVEATLSGLLPDSSKWNIKLYNYNSARGLPGAIVSNRFTFTQRQWDDNSFVQASYQNKKSARYNFMFNTKYAYSFMRYLDPEFKIQNGFLDNRYTETEWYISAANLYKISKIWEISLATDYSLQRLDANLYDFAYPSRNTGLVVLASALNLNRLIVQGNILATLIAEQVKNGDQSANRQEYTPSLMASWQPFQSKDFRIRSFYKSIFRMPTFNDLYYTFIGNTKLKPEYTKQYDLGFTYGHTSNGKRLAYLSIQTDAYYNLVKDKIVAIPGNNLGRWTMVNLDRVQIKGFETNIQTVWDFAAQLKLKASANYTFEKAVDISATAFRYGDQIPYIPVHSGSARFGIDYKNLAFNYSYIYTGERYSQKANITANYVKPWYTHDLAIGANFACQQTRFFFNAEINNVFNQYYDVVLNYPMPGRNYRFTLSTNF
ncbi:TonB-dependent receptor plug domain-containing protein [Pedobacter alluvionis]|uniref:Outer membrane cobalamin receptor n=1 Tax=Pedobacter alluvionis TaxID=475253 RepID=A0A497XX87_9SPHI|nr:TonB-dependent receptor [Pedobacter alluvionis]RLJ74810.1 outer membrane cobalamin receptor [Pedobacter alluvionis]TFB29941.1 TonB-dependent receptor [Pedobacter alluvionis]